MAIRKPTLGRNNQRGDIFRELLALALYLELGSLIPVVEELDRRGWRMKAEETVHDLPPVVPSEPASRLEFVNGSAC